MGTPCALSGRPPGLLVQEPEAGVVGQFTRRRGRASALLRDWPIFFRASSDRLAARREASAGQSSHGGVRRSPASFISVRPKECRGGDASPPRSIGRACRGGEGEMPLDP
jgi:hypothetical protein